MTAEWWTSYKLVAGGAKAIYSHLNMESLIREIKRELNQVYSDVASANFNAAENAFIARHNSKNPEQEVRSGIGHLRSAYFIYEKLLSKTTMTRFLLFFTEEVSAIDEREKQEVEAKLANLATLIFFNYTGLGEQENAEEWKILAFKYFDLSEQHYFYILERDLPELKKLYPSYVHTVNKALPSIRSGMWIDNYVSELTPAGKKYLEPRLKELKESRAQSFRKIFTV